MSPADILALSRLLRSVRLAVPETADEKALQDALLSSSDERVFVERIVDRGGLHPARREDHDTAPDRILCVLDFTDHGPDGAGPPVDVVYSFEREEP